MHAPSVVPGFAQFAATADVGDREDDSAVEQAEAIGAESDRRGDAVTAVAVEEKWSAAVAGSLVVVDHGDGDFGAVGRDGVEALAGVDSRIVAAENGLLFAED